MPWPTSESACTTVQPWNLPLLYASGSAAALRMRARLVPYTYTHARVAFDAGVALIRPMYYYYPELDGAYPDMDTLLGHLPGSRQFFFGDALLVAPVTTPAICTNAEASIVAADVVATGDVQSLAVAQPPDGPCGISQMDVWLPPGVWFEVHTGSLLTIGEAEGKTRTIGVHLYDTPVYAKGGAAVPNRVLPASASTIGLAAQPYDFIEWTIYPGAKAGNGTMYEDDGETYDYLKGAFATTHFEYAWSGASLSVHVSVEPPPANLRDPLPSQRALSVRLPNALPPASVLLNGSATPLRWSRYGGVSSGSWHYDGDELAVVIDLPARRTLDAIALTVVFSSDTSAIHKLSGLKGKFAAARRAKANLNLRRMAPGEHSGHVDPLGAPLALSASAPERLGYLAQGKAFDAFLANVSTTYDAAAAQIRALANSTKGQDRQRATYSSQILEAAA